MALDLISNLVNLFFKDRIEEINEYRLNFSDIQNEQFFDLIREAEDTEWGKKYDLKTIHSYQDFRERIPLMSADDLRPYVERMEHGESNLLWPGLPKKILNSFNGSRIPVSEQALTEIFLQGINDCYAIYLQQNSDSKLFAGYFVSAGNEGEKPFLNELFTLIRENEPFLNSLFNLPKQFKKYELSGEYIENLLNEVSTEKISCFKGSPKSLVSFLSKAEAYKDKDGKIPFLEDYEILFHRTTRLSADIEKERSELNLSTPVQVSYCSPEGFFGIQYEQNDCSLLLMLDLSTFYEFLPIDCVDAQPVPLEDINTGTDYQLVITNCSGLWRYASEGPGLRFVSKNPYRFLLV